MSRRKLSRPTSPSTKRPSPSVSSPWDKRPSYELSYSPCEDSELSGAEYETIPPEKRKGRRAHQSRSLLPGGILHCFISGRRAGVLFSAAVGDLCLGVNNWYDGRAQSFWGLGLFCVCDYIELGFQTYGTGDVTGWKLIFNSTFLMNRKLVVENIFWGIIVNKYIVDPGDNQNSIQDNWVKLILLNKSWLQQTFHPPIDWVLYHKQTFNIVKKI